MAVGERVRIQSVVAVGIGEAVTREGVWAGHW